MSGYPHQNPSGYGAPPSSQPYGAPPSSQPYGAPAANPYGAPAANPYGAPAQPYGAPPAQQYGQPAQQYGQPAASPYGAPAQPYGAPPANPYGAPSAPYGAQQQGTKPPKDQSNKPSSSPYGAPQPQPSGGGGYPPQAAYGSPFSALLPSTFPPGTDPNVVACFQVADQDGSGLIDDKELQNQDVLEALKREPFYFDESFYELAYGAQNLTADDLDVEEVSTEKLREALEALEQGNKAMVKNRITASEKKYKTDRITLSKEAIEAQYGKTIKEAAKALEVSLSTLKRKCKAVGISEWQGPSPTKRKVSNSSNQSARNEKYDGAVQDSSVINKNENTLTIKAKYKKDMIKFHLCMSETTLIILEEKIGKKFKLTHGTYKLKYFDDDKDWILLDSDEAMSDCMKSSRILGQNVVRLRVLVPISG